MAHEGRRRGRVALWLSVGVAIVLALAAAAALRWPGWVGVANRAEVQSRTATVGPHPTSAGRPTLWVLAIGISKYDDPRLALRFAAADAEAVAEAFTAQRGGPLYRAVETEVLVDADATRANILRAMDDFIGGGAPGDVGVVYLAGHGVHDETVDNYYFLPATASADRPWIEGLDMRDFNRQLRALHHNLGRLVIIIDTCHASAVADGSGTGEDLSVRLPPAADNLYVLAAAKSGEQSHEDAALGHGVFTMALLEALQGGGADADGLIGVLGLANFVKRVVPQRTDEAQTPYFAFKGEDLPLVAHPHRFAQITPPPLPSPAAMMAAPPRERVVVMNFESLRPDPHFDWMQQALPEQIATALHQAGPFEIYDERMLRFLARGATDPLEAAQRADMTKLVDGAYWVSDGKVYIIAHVKNTNPLKSVAYAMVEGPLKLFSELTIQLVVDLLKQAHVDLSASEIEQLLQHRTTDFNARKLLFDAEQSGAEDRARTPTPREQTGPTVPPAALLLEHLDIATASYAADDYDPEAELRATLEGYRRAFEREDVDGLARYYTEFTPEQRDALQRYFDNAVQLRVQFHDIQIAIIGDRAAVSFSREDHFVDRKSGDAQQVVVRVTKVFAKGPAAWQIVPEP